MLSTHDGVSLRLSASSEARVLHPARIVAVEDNILTASFDDPEVRAHEGQEATLFFFAPSNGAFMQQPVRIDTVLRTDGRPVIAFSPVGDPVSAESRQSYRVSTALAETTARVGKESNCLVLDVSATGLSVVVSRPVSLGDVVPIVLEFEGAKYHGNCVVQSATKFDDIRKRIGLLYRPGSGTSSLGKGLGVVTAEIQRRQLRRRAGA